MLELFAHPFSSYCWKALIALYEGEVPFTYRLLDPEHPENAAELARLWPIGKFPVLRDGDQVIVEATSIIEYLAVRHTESLSLIPSDPLAAQRVRMLDRVFDNYVMSPMQRIVGDALRQEGLRDPTGVAEAHAVLDTAYAWLDGQLDRGAWASGTFSLADCAAAPSLFYADWVHPIEPAHAALRDYRACLLARPSIARVVDEARPYRHFFPLGAPDRD
jgi:glutathione S-transferase